MARPEADPVPHPQDAGALLRLAVTAVRDRLAGTGDPLVAPRADRWPGLWVPGATFVTLTVGGRLRGCVGSLYPHRPLAQDVVRNARLAVADPRLAPVVPAEWPDLDITVTVLTSPEPLPATARADLVAALRPGYDGLILAAAGRRATFLPAVWHRLAEPAAFVAALLDKGGWAAWPDGVRAWRYAATEYTDRPPRAPLAVPTGGGDGG